MYKVIIKHGSLPDEVIICQDEVEAIQEYLTCASCFGYNNVRIEEVYE